MSTIGAVQGMGQGPTPATARERLQRQAQELESVFYAQLFQAMRQTVPSEGGLLEQSTGEQMFTSMLDEQVARFAAERSDSGLAAAMTKQLGRNLPTEGAAETAAPAAGSGDVRGG
jgi:flagellar protein FlgJ